ncbi:hypothetical protein GCM10027347_61560 [Larkinella harenae]
MAKKSSTFKPFTAEERQEQIRQIDEVFPDSAPAYIAKKREIDELMYLKHPGEDQHRLIIESFTSHAIKGGKISSLISGFMGFIAAHRYSHGSDIEPTFDDYQTWLDALPFSERENQIQLGFEGCKQKVREYVQRKQMSQDEYLKMKLLPKDLQLHYAVINYIKLKDAGKPENLPKN